MPRPSSPGSVGASPQAEAVVVSKAATRAAAHLHLTNTALAKVLGISEASASRLRGGTFVLEAGSKPFELAVLLLSR